MFKYLAAAVLGVLAVTGFTAGVYASPAVAITGVEETLSGSGVRVECSITGAAESQRITVVSCEAAEVTGTEDVVFMDEFEAEITEEGTFTFEFEPADWVTYGKSYILRVGGAGITEPAELAVTYSGEYIIIAGDVDGDGSVTLIDAILVLKHIENNYVIEDDKKEAADVNGDSSITNADAALILKAVSGLNYDSE